MELSSGKSDSLQQVVADELLDNLNKNNVGNANYSEDPNLVSSSVDDNGTITNKFEDTTTGNADYTVKDAVDDFVKDHYDVTDDKLDDAYDAFKDLNDLFKNELNDTKSVEGGKTK